MSNNSTGIRPMAVLVSALVAGVLVGIGLYVSNQDRGDPVAFTGLWEPGDNHVDFYYLIGVDGNLIRPDGPRHTHEDIAQPGQRLELLITSRPEEPVVLRECQITYPGGVIVGQVLREGSICQAIGTIPA